MTDDKGFIGRGHGEQVIDYLMKSDEIHVRGVIAVASDTGVKGVEVDCSINAEGHVVRGPVDKYGCEERPGHKRLEGDTLEVLKIS